MTELGTTSTPVEAPRGRDFSLLDGLGVARRLFDRIRAQVRGRDEVVELVLIALLADGHVLLEDFPGSGKTTLAKALGDAMHDPRDAASRGAIEPFRRIQFTPDLLPSDVTGTTVFEPRTGSFTFRPGPIFAHVVLADEINRTSPKVQAAMLEAMAEKQVTVDNQTRPLDDLFFVIATQNPLDLAGTYPLPVAQLDRFLFKIRMSHIDRESELDVLRTIRDRREGAARNLPRVSRDEVLITRRAIEEQVYVHPLIHDALVDIARAIREDRRVLQGVSTRSLVLALPALQARAMIYGRDYVGGEDLEVILPRVFGHRMELSAGGAELDEVIDASLRPAIERVARATMQRSSA
ncbi:MAG: AAA family ATPase [Deltaproteobacteria bacterium]|nr:AAA family ATPase [Deltaproteobacteria bacterium]